MSRLGLRELRKPNIHGATLAVDTVTVAPTEVTEQSTNRVQTGNKEVTEQSTNRVQTGNKEVTEPKTVEAAPQSQTTKQVTQRVTSNRVNRVQTEYKQSTNTGFETLRGLESKLLQLIFEECHITGDLLTPPLTLDRISVYLESQKSTAKTIIFRLTRKGFITRESSATGRGGFTRFRIEKDLYQTLLLRRTEYKEVTNRVQTGNKEVTQRVTQRVTSPSSSSSFLELENLKTTTTGELDLFDPEIRLAPEWQTVDATPLTEIGFTQTHLIQIIRQGKLTPTEVQDSIQFFSFDLKRNRKGRELSGSPLNFFMGILRKGIPYAPPENYESPAAEARRKVREFKEREERERQAEEQKIMELEFSEWKRGLLIEDISQIVPEYARKPGPLQDSALKTYYETHIWSKRFEEALCLTKVSNGDIVQQIQTSLQGSANE